MEIQKKKYQIQIEEYLNFYQQRVFFYLYQPLIGQKAVSLYNFLFQEEEFARNVNFNLELDRLLNFLLFQKKDLDEAIKILSKFNLLKTFYDFKTNNLLFIVKKPISVSEFYKSVYFDEFKMKFNSEIIEQIYFWLRPRHFNSEFNINEFTENKIDIDQKHEIHLFLKNILKIKSSEYKIKIKDFEFIKKLNQLDKIPLKSIEILIDFMFFRINAFSIAYLKKVVDTLKDQNIYQNFHKTQLFLQSLFQNMPLFQIENNKQNIPSWLNQTKIKNENTIFTFDQEKFDKYF